MRFGPLNAEASGFLRLVGRLVLGFGSSIAEWTSQCGELCICQIDRSAVRRTDDGHALVFWSVARSARAIICDRGFCEAILDFSDVAS
jgi:hypothetical protein